MRFFLDMFSGIGGFALGAKWAGIEFDGHYFSEIDEYAIKVYQKRFPKAESLGDIRNVDYGKLPEGEYFVTAGFPCQPHSVAGKKGGEEDERDLWPECRRLLRELRPAIALFENVPGLFTSPGKDRKGEFFNGVLSDISASRYDAEWQVISAAEIGAPHLRERVWIFCYPTDAGGGGQPHYWRTPDANMERGNRSYENMKMRIEEGKPLNLNDQINAIDKGLLPTPRVSDYNTPCLHGKGGMDLRTAVSLWPTPKSGGNRNSRNAIIGKNTGGKHKSDMGLEQAVEVMEGILPRELHAIEELPPRFQQVWPTPDTRGFTNTGSLKMLASTTINEEEFKGMSYRAGKRKKHNIWGTPTANDAKNSITGSQRNRGTLTASVVEAEGENQSKQLNADWTERLMGYPLFWTDINKESGMDTDFPLAWLNGTWEDGIPRIITGQKNRVKRLKCLGNTVIPQIPMLLWFLIIKCLFGNAKDD